MDTGQTGDAVFEIQPVFVCTQLVVQYGNFPAFGDGNGDFVAVGIQIDDVENDIVFTVKVLKFFEIKFVHMSFSFWIF